MDTKKHEKAVNQALDTLFDAEPEHVIIINAHKKYKGEKFSMAFHTMFKELSKDQDLQGKDLKVLLNLIGHLSFENYVAVRQTTIASELKMLKQNVHRSLKKLLDKGYIEAATNEDGLKVLRINPELVWMGRIATREKVQKEQEKHES